MGCRGMGAPRVAGGEGSVWGGVPAVGGAGGAGGGVGVCVPGVGGGSVCVCVCVGVCVCVCLSLVCMIHPNSRVLKK